MPVLVLRSVDDSANLRVMRAVLEALRARDYGRLRVGPVDDGRAAEVGAWGARAQGRAGAAAARPRPAPPRSRRSPTPGASAAMIPPPRAARARAGEGRDEA